MVDELNPSSGMMCGGGDERTRRLGGYGEYGLEALRRRPKGYRREATRTRLYETSRGKRDLTKTSEHLRNG